MEEERETLFNIHVEISKEDERRKRLLFNGILVFLVVDAAFFFLGILWASYVVGHMGGDWHLYATALLPGGLGAVIALMFLKAVFRVPRQDAMKSGDILPTGKALTEAVQDLSQD